MSPTQMLKARRCLCSANEMVPWQVGYIPKCSKGSIRVECDLQGGQWQQSADQETPASLQEQCSAVPVSVSTFHTFTPSTQVAEQNLASCVVIAGIFWSGNVGPCNNSICYPMYSLMPISTRFRKAISSNASFCMSLDQCRVSGRHYALNR
eukprot:scaffold297260_cov40-Prasinocladus_malaysianus.AAC.1